MHRPRTRCSRAHFGSACPSLLSQLSGYIQPHSHALTPRTCVAQELQRTLFVSCPKTITPHRAMSYITPHLMTPSTGTPSSLVLEPFLSACTNLCEDLRPQLSGALAEPRPFAGYEPKQVAEDQDYKHFTGDRQLTEREDLRVKPLSFHQPSTASTYDSAESIATPHPGLGLRR